jgi:glycine/D-amino acid oxidase-like deaminating enzyme
MPLETTLPATLPLIQADPARLTHITVCTRPFRAAGPRIEAEQIGDKLVVHNYGHGGSGWSLSWGSAEIALQLALASRDPSLTDLAVIGCGALGLTSAIAAQRAGVRSVTIYSKDAPSQTRSFRATGAWTPDSRIALASVAPPAFADQWEQMARTSWGVFQQEIQKTNGPIQLQTRYTLSDDHPTLADQKKYAADTIGFARFQPLISALMPHIEDLGPGQHPFPTQWARRDANVIFHITELVQTLTDEFLAHGGTLVTQEFHTPTELSLLPQPVILHSTGYAARRLFGDTTLTPIRGQIGWLPTQPELNYSIYFDTLNIVPRRDGIVVQTNPLGEATGWNIDDEGPNPTESQTATRQLQSLMAKMPRP